MTLETRMDARQKDAFGVPEKSNDDLLIQDQIMSGKPGYYDHDVGDAHLLAMQLVSEGYTWEMNQIDRENYECAFYMGAPPSPRFTAGDSYAQAIALAAKRVKGL